MKRSAFRKKRTVPMKRSGFKKKLFKGFGNELPLGLLPEVTKKVTFKPRKPLKRTKLHVKGHSTVTQIKDDIQATLRAIVMIRDKKCILYGIKCNHEIGMEGIVWQAEHLIERSNSATFADSRLVVLIAKNCHGWKHFKKSNHDQYDKWVKTKLSKERVELWEKCEADSWKPVRTGAYDWQMALVALKQELERLEV